MLSDEEIPEHATTRHKDVEEWKREQEKIRKEAAERAAWIKKREEEGRERSRLERLERLEREQREEEKKRSDFRKSIGL